MKKVFSLSIIISLFISFSSLQFAQDITPVINSQLLKEIEYNSISVIEIPQKIEEVNTFLKNINAIEIPATEFEKSEENFNTFLTDIEQLKKESTQEIFKNTTTKKLKDYSLKWNSYIENFKNSLQETSQRLDSEREQIKKVLIYWELTYTNAKRRKPLHNY